MNKRSIFRIFCENSLHQTHGYWERSECYSLCELFICYCIPGVHLYKKILQIFAKIPDLTLRNMPLLEPQWYWLTDGLFKEKDWVLWTEVCLCLCMFKITNISQAVRLSMFNFAIRRFNKWTLTIFIFSYYFLIKKDQILKKMFLYFTLSVNL